MGQMLAQVIGESDLARLTAALERPGHARIGTPIAMSASGAPALHVTSDVDAALTGADAIIDFTTPQASVDMAARAAAAGVVHVIGTTGFDTAQCDAIAEAARHGVIVRAGNMSLGVNMLVALTRQVAAALGEDYDIEIVEAHHRHKVDAPSGTALMLGEAAARARGMSLADAAQHGRSGITGARASGMIGFHAIRGGDVIGDHDVVFAGPGERVVLRHLATDRAVFARGALRAALWAQGRAAGEYTMADVLGLER